MICFASSSKSCRRCDMQYHMGLQPCRALVSANYKGARKIQLQFCIYKSTVKQLHCCTDPALWLTEPHRKSVSCISQNRGGQYWYFKQLSICSRQHPSDKMIKRSAFQTMTPAGQQRCRARLQLHLSGCISSEKSLPTLGRKISKENQPPPAGKENRAELLLTAGKPLSLHGYSCT